MKSWAFWNTNLSTYYTVYLMLKSSYLALSAQFFILRVELNLPTDGGFQHPVRREVTPLQDY